MNVSRTDYYEYLIFSCILLLLGGRLEPALTSATFGCAFAVCSFTSLALRQLMLEEGSRPALMAPAPLFSRIFLLCFLGDVPIFRTFHYSRFSPIDSDSAALAALPVLGRMYSKNAIIIKLHARSVEYCG